MKTIKLSDDKWQDLCAKIDNEGLCYYIMDYESKEGFSEAVNGDEKAIELFEKAQDILREFRNYLKLNDF